MQQRQMHQEGAAVRQVLTHSNRCPPPPPHHPTPPPARLGGLLGQCGVVEGAGGDWVQAQVELVGPAGMRVTVGEAAVQMVRAGARRQGGGRGVQCSRHAVRHRPEMGRGSDASAAAAAAAAKLSGCAHTPTSGTRSVPTTARHRGAERQDGPWPGLPRGLPACRQSHPSQSPMGGEVWVSVDNQHLELKPCFCPLTTKAARGGITQHVYAAPHRSHSRRSYPATTRPSRQC